MRNFHPLGSRRPLALLGSTLGFLLLLWPALSLRSDEFVFYVSKERRVVASQVIGNVSYLPVLDVLNAVGKVSGWEEKRSSLRIWFGDNQLELHLDKNKVKLGKSEVALSGPVRISNGQWLVPADFLTALLPQLIHQPVQYTAAARSVVIGGVKPISFSLRLDAIPNGARLSVQFSSPVTVRTVSRNGKWILFLGDVPVAPPQDVFHFQGPYVAEVRYDDQDGQPKLVITPAGDGLNLYVSPGTTKALVAEVVKPASAPAVQQAAKPSPAPPGNPSAPSQAAAPSPAPATPPAPPPESTLPVVVLDAGHGGTDSGARSRNGILEKDLVAQVGERVRAALVATNKYRIVETRIGDSDPSFDDRAIASNAAHAVAFISLHAGNFGDVVPRVAVYSYQPSTRAASSSPAGPRRVFVPWDAIQERWADRSRQLAQALGEQFGKLPAVSTRAPVGAPVRTLRSVDAPAVAIEIGSLAPDVDAGPLTDQNFQQQIATAIAQAVDAFGGGHP